MSTEVEPVIPDYQERCTTNVVPELVRQVMGDGAAAWLPEDVHHARQVVLLVLDGLGWNQLQEHVALAPTLTGFSGGAITTVAPTTTAAALTSIVTGRPPAVHRIAGYRLCVDGDVLDVLKWQTSAGDAREAVPPHAFQRQPAFAANEVPVVTRRAFMGTGFAEAHLQGARMVGYAAPSSIPVEVWRLTKAGEPFVYAYYDGIDSVAHANGFGEHYDAELYTADRLVRDLLAGLPSGCALVVTSDHGQVQVGGRNVELDPDVVEMCSVFSGEGRFRWLRAADGDVDALAERCRERFGELAWVRTRQQVSDEGWFGGPIDDELAARLGDVVLAASAPISFRDPASAGSTMLCQHGSLTADEVLVPLLAKCV